MSKFDNTVNAILENLIFEQDQVEETDPSQKIMDQTLQDIEAKKKEDLEGYQKESEAKYTSDEGFLSELNDYLSKFSTEQQQSLTEEVAPETPTTGMEQMWQGAKEMGKKGLDYASKTFGPTLSELGDALADKVGDYATQFIGEKYVKDIQNNLSENMLYKIAAIFLDPTGIMSWPYYRTALDEYKKHEGTEDEDIYFLNLLAATISVIPGVRVPLGILTAPFKLVTKGFTRVFFGGRRGLSIVRRLASFIRGGISKSAAAEKVLAKTESSALRKGLGKGGKMLAKGESAAAKGASPILKGILKGGKTVGKLAAQGAKAATVVASGDIPQTWKDWTEYGKERIGQIKPQGTLGKFPSFSGLSTQKF